MIRRVICALALIASASPAAAQNAILFFPRFDFRMGADHLSGDDARFVWDANFGGEMDLVDYGRGRMTFAANYEAVLGEQFRRFDVNQGNYLARLLDVAAGARRRGCRAVSSHVAPLERPFQAGPCRLEHVRGPSPTRREPPGDADSRTGRRARRASEIERRLQLGGERRSLHRVPLHPRISAISAGSARLVGVDGTRRRGTQHGARGEAGLRFEGQGGAVEVIVTVERRIDPYPLENSPMSWFSAGFRFVSR